MKIKSILLVMLTLCLVIGLCACGDNADDGSTQTTTGTNNTNATATTTTTVTPTTTTTLAEGKVTYIVKVTDEGGNPIPGAWPQLCLDACIPMGTNEQGIATFLNMDEANYDVKFMRVPEGYEMPVDDKGEAIVYHFEEGSYELTLVLKAVA